MPYRASWLFFWFAFIIPASGAEHVISVVDHPGAHAMKPVIRSAYQQLGLTVRFEPMPIGRRLLALQNGTTDGDVLARSNLQDKYSQVLRVGPPITQVDVLLVCPAEVRCDNSVLVSGEATVVIDRGSAMLIREGLRMALPERHEYIESPPLRTSLFNRQRIDYFIYFKGNGIGGYAVTRAHKKHLIGRHQFYHYINQRHASLAKPLSAALTRALRRHPPSQIASQ